MLPSSSLSPTLSRTLSSPKGLADMVELIGHVGASLFVASEKSHSVSPQRRTEAAAQARTRGVFEQDPGILHSRTEGREGAGTGPLRQPPTFQGHAEAAPGSREEEGRGLGKPQVEELLAPAGTLKRLAISRRPPVRRLGASRPRSWTMIGEAHKHGPRRTGHEARGKTRGGPRGSMPGPAWP